MPHERQRPAGEDLNVGGQRDSVRSMQPWRERVVADSTRLVPGVGGEVVDLPADVQDGVAQRVVLGGAVGVRDDDRALGLGAGDVLHDRQHGGDAGAGAGQQQRPVGRLDDEVARRGADLQHVPRRVTVSCRNVETCPSGAPSTPRTRRTVICSRLPERGGGHGVLPRLPLPVGQVHEDRDVLARADRAAATAVARVPAPAR